MPTLNWIGKEKVVTHHLDVPYRVLNRKYTFGDTSDSGNMIIHGDNLEALKALLPQYEGKIKCIYIDPPYNTGNEGWVYNDNVNDPHIRRWLGQVVGSEADDLTRHDKWLCMMYPRLALLQRLLSEDGAIFISIDEIELANLRLICNEIFGQSNFVGLWQWYKSATPPNLSYKIKRNLEYVLCYEKHKTSLKYKGVQKTSNSNDPITKPQNSFKTLTFPVGSIRIQYIENGVVEAGTYGTGKFPNRLLNTMQIVNGKNANEVSFENRFIWVQEKLEEEILRGTIIDYSRNGVLSYKKANYDPEVPPNLIDSSVGVDTTEEAGKILANIFGRDNVFEFPKHPSLIEYLINFLSDKDSIILDSFAGSGTTAHAVLNLNKQDGGNRKFILCEMMDYAENITAERVRRVMKGYGEGKNAVEGTGGSFDFYELGETIFDPVTGNLNDDADTEQIRRYVWFSETNSPYTAPSADAHPYFLGTYQHNNYYFYYIREEETCLDRDFLRTFTQKDKAEMYIIYADRCVLTSDEMLRMNIRFKKIPRDIKRV
ncbi:MAG: site-specific DNA-methyltransferase [Bacteroidales bacterium]|nr:site-specific DNA-methyltransferase [Bacteroidales bacterium]